MFLLIDGTNLAHRAYFAAKTNSHRLQISSSGVPISCTKTVLTGLLSTIQKYSPTHVAVVFDLAGCKTFRHQLFEGYKSNRPKKDADLINDLTELQTILEKAGIGIVAPAGYEADDLLATLAVTQSHEEALVYSGDRDLFQLATEKVHILYPETGRNASRMTPESITAKMQISPSQITDYKGLRGDDTDCIPGVKGIGEKTSIKLLKQYGSIEGVYANIGTIAKSVKTRLEQGQVSATLSKQLATLVTTIPLDIDVQEAFNLENADLWTIAKRLKELGLSVLASSYEQKFPEKAPF